MNDGERRFTPGLNAKLKKFVAAASVVEVLGGCERAGGQAKRGRNWLWLINGKSTGPSGPKRAKVRQKGKGRFDGTSKNNGRGGSDNSLLGRGEVTRDGGRFVGNGGYHSKACVWLWGESVSTQRERPTDEKGWGVIKDIGGARISISLHGGLQCTE